MIKKNDLESTIKEYCTEQEDIVAVYIFGSFVNGNFNQNSDIDLGVITSSKLDKISAFDLKLELEIDLEKLVDREVDVVLFSQAPLKLKHQIINGKLIVENNKKVRVRKETKARDEYLDMKYFHDVYKDKLGKGIDDG